MLECGKTNCFEETLKFLNQIMPNFGPEGEMACGEFGIGRMMEPQQIVQSLVEIISVLKAKKA